jgi:hypothetical protein
VPFCKTLRRRVFFVQALLMSTAFRSVIAVAVSSALGLALGACNSPETQALNDAARHLDRSAAAAQSATVPGARVPVGERTVANAARDPLTQQALIGLTQTSPANFATRLGKPFSDRIAR